MNAATRFFVLSSFAAVLTVCATPSRAFSQEGNNGTASSLSPSSYPDSPEGLRNLVETIFGAIRLGDKAKTSAYCSNLLISDHAAWFVKVFGSTEGSRLDAKYGGVLAANPSLFSDLFATSLFHNRTNLKVTILQHPVDSGPRLAQVALQTMAMPVPLYYLEGRNDDPKDPFPVSGIGYFVYVDGGFRFLPTEVLEALSTAPPLRIRIPESVLRSQITYKVAPVYPDQAKAGGIKGDVVVHIVVGTDGAVKEAAVVSGDPALGQAALDAVRQWKCRPTLLNSKPVEVDSTVTVRLP
jgi:TonB family protein